MTSQRVFRLPFSLLILAFCLAASSTFADSSHARIIRLSYVQGDVRITHNVSGDPLQSGDNAWESATLNMPIHQGDAVATDNGRAEVEFESGNVAFLAENTVLEFYDLSLEDGSFTTRLILRQGSASFSVRPGRGDYFSVTGGDFSVEANEKARFRVNNYDDGSDVQVSQGHISVLVKDKTTSVSKGQSLSMRVSDPTSVSVDGAAYADDFDQWVAGRIESAQTALTASQQYSGVYDYTSGFGDLYTYGSWYSVAGYGYCWRPYGVSFGWNPFGFGHWFFDPNFGGWVFIGSQPWGWLPYHYGSWIYHPGFGWVWSSVGSFPRGVPYPYARVSRTGQWRPVTATWVRSGNQVGLVPTHPMDTKGKTPINLREGVFPVSTRGVLEQVGAGGNDNWKNVKNPARDVLPSATAGAAPPVRVVRSMAGGGSAPGVVTANRESGITFDPREHRFVNNANATSSERVAVETKSGVATREGNSGIDNGGAKTSDMRRGAEAPGGRGSVPTTSRASGAPLAPRGPAMPPRAPAVGSSARGGGSSAASSGGSRWGGSSGSSSGASSRSSAGSSSSSSSAGSSRSSSPSSSSSGGRPH
jgi:hypothetical protein